MKLPENWIFSLLLAGMVFAGCASAPPNWAPKNPSPEFSRAATFLNPLPGNDPAFEAGKPDFMPPAWELFGTLSDGQIETFKQERRLALPFPQMTEKQKSLVNNLLAGWQKNQSADQPPITDFANGDALFLLRAEDRVVLMLEARPEKGKVVAPLPMGLGWLKP